MPNDADNDRIASTTKGGNIVNLSEYRAQADNIKRSTAQDYGNIAAFSFLPLIAVVLIFLFLFRR